MGLGVSGFRVWGVRSLGVWGVGFGVSMLGCPVPPPPQGQEVW